MRRRTLTPSIPKKPSTSPRGHCQACNSVQRVRNGKLAKHGYQVYGRGQGGFFTGTCPGSGERPLEQCCLFAQECYDLAKKNAQLCQEASDRALERDTSSGIGWKWLNKRDGGVTWAHWEENFQYITADLSVDHAADKAAKGNREFSEAKLREKIAAERYMQFLFDLFSNWTMKPLLPA